MLAQFVQIKDQIIAQIEQGGLKPGDRVASENQLAEDFGVSRMTARRALTELVDEGILLRSQGLGTFVSDHRPMSSILHIRSIKDEIEQRGHSYSNQVLSMHSIQANEQSASWLGVAVGSDIFHSQVVHLESGAPIQFEDRLVNPRWAPEYLQQDFSTLTANEYLGKVAPLTEADHIVEAIIAAPGVANILAIDAQQPCLKVSRRSYSRQGVVSYAVLYHPGNKYRLGGHLDF